MTLSEFRAACAITQELATRWWDPVSQAAGRFSITAPARLAAFLAQVGHESMGFTKTEECLNYSPQAILATWPKHFTPDEAVAYGRQPERIANRAYACRMGNGDEASGDGWRHRGMGLIQVTGRENQEACLRALGMPVEDPGALSDPLGAALSAGWFWSTRGCNALADAGDFEGITRRINGGLIGQADRAARWETAKAALGG